MLVVLIDNTAVARRGHHLNQRVRERIRTLMEQAGVKQKGLERATGYRQSDISRFLSGQMKYPPLEFLDTLCRVFSYTLADLLRDELPQPSVSAGEASVLAAYRVMKPHERGALDTLLLARRPHGGRT